MTSSRPSPPIPSDSRPASEWENAYLRFETPAEEVTKFRKRLQLLGALDWPQDARIVELFCGRGSGLLALGELGFARIAGIDLSPALAREHSGGRRIVVADCRRLPLANESQDVLIAQGGLHHLPDLPHDVDTVTREVERVLVRGGLFVVVEPWDTPFLRVVHALCSVPVARRVSAKVDALATMIDHERDTYERWLSMPGILDQTITQRFDAEHRYVGWGKFMFVGKKP